MDVNDIVENILQHIPVYLLPDFRLVNKLFNEVATILLKKYDSSTIKRIVYDIPIVNLNRIKRDKEKRRVNTNGFSLTTISEIVCYKIWNYEVWQDLLRFRSPWIDLKHFTITSRRRHGIYELSIDNLQDHHPSIKEICSHLPNGCPIYYTNNIPVKSLYKNYSKEQIRDRYAFFREEGSKYAVDSQMRQLYKFKQCRFSFTLPCIGWSHWTIMGKYGPENKMKMNYVELH